MPGDAYANDVNAHYTEDDLESTVLGILASWGKSEGVLTPADLAPIDQFHVGGLEATRALAERAGITASTRVLDVGGGLGGPARTLAATYGCAVTVLDLTESFVSVGTMLTARSGLSDLVKLDHGDALNMPYPDGSFDLVWTQHSSMNIDDKPKLYAEIARVTKPGGRLALHEIMSDADKPLIYPLPWARDASISFLWTPERIRALLAGLGYREIAWDDLTDPGVIPQNPPPGNGGPTPGLQIIAGADFPERASNLRKNFAEHRVRLIRAVLELN
jgi:SAM-dependent methyltransferase